MTVLVALRHIQQNSSTLGGNNEEGGDLESRK